MKIICTKQLSLPLLFLVFILGQNVFSQEKSEVASTLSRSLFESDDVTSQWRSLAAAVQNFNGTFVRQTMYEADKLEVIEKTEFKRKEDHTKSEVWRLKNDSQALVKRSSYCANPHYSFILRNKADAGTNDNWNILNVQKQTFDPELDAVLRYETNSGPLGYMSASFSIAGFPLWSLVKDENFVISNVKRTGADSEMVSIEFLWNAPACMFPEKSVNISRSVKGYVEFNTQKYWRIEKLFFCVSYREGGKQALIYLNNYLEYSETENGIPYVVKCTEYTSAVKHGEKKLPAFVHEMVDVNFTPAADSEFTLSYYNLPEPDFDKHRVSWLRYTFMLIGGLLMVYALCRMIRERKDKEPRQ